MPTAIQQFYDCLIQSIDAVKAWADRVPGFAELCKHDQDQLFQTAALELVMLRIAYTCRSASHCQSGSINAPQAASRAYREYLVDIANLNR